VSPFDPGLQPERTALAWRRAGLSLGVGSLAAGRLLEPVVHDAWVLGGAVGVLVYTDLWVGFTAVTALLILGLAQTLVSFRGNSLIPGLGGNRPIMVEQEGNGACHGEYPPADIDPECIILQPFAHDEPPYGYGEQQGYDYKLHKIP